MRMVPRFLDVERTRFTIWTLHQIAADVRIRNIHAGFWYAERHPRVVGSLGFWPRNAID
jgi:hypothetical protein